MRLPFKSRNTDFINNMVDQGYAEKVPKQELERRDVKVWYILHHGVYHPCKGKLQVVFDWSRIQGNFYKLSVIIRQV